MKKAEDRIDVPTADWGLWTELDRARSCPDHGPHGSRVLTKCQMFSQTCNNARVVEGE